MKPDIVFFGEGLGEDFHKSISEDQEECDLLIVIGSSMKVCVDKIIHVSSDRGSGRWPSKNKEARERRVAILATTA